ncbi:putative membrane protein YczE [Bacillus sp. SLBN-57]
MKYLFYVIGILILTLGIAFTIQSDLGASPFDALLVGLAVHAGLTVGSWEVIIALLLIGCNSFLKRQRPEVSGLLTAFITGIGIDMWLFLLHFFVTPEQWYNTNFASMPIDRLTFIIKELTGTNIFFSRTIIYLVFLTAAVMLKGPIGIGTLLTVCLGGLALHLFMPFAGKVLGRFTDART